MDDQSRIVTHLAENLRNQKIASSVYWLYISSYSYARLTQDKNPKREAQGGQRCEP